MYLSRAVALCLSLVIVLAGASAAAAALTWAVYSLLIKRVPPFPTAAVGGFCLVSGLLSLIIHALAEPAYSPSQRDWSLLLLLGAGPMGATFFTWDAAMKRGDPRIIGALAYLTPLTSTLVLVLLGGHPFTGTTAAATLLIMAGALIGSMLIQARARFSCTPNTSRTRATTTWSASVSEPSHSLIRVTPGGGSGKR